MPCWVQDLKVINSHLDQWPSILLDRLQQFKFSVLSILLWIDLFSQTDTVMVLKVQLPP